jgi:hypothetical protein
MRVNFTRKRVIFTRLRVDFFLTRMRVGFCVLNRHAIFYCVIINQKIYQDKRLVNGAMDSITEIIWPLFLRTQLYDQDIWVVKIHHNCINSSKIQLWNS